MVGKRVLLITHHASSGHTCYFTFNTVNPVPVYISVLVLVKAMTARGQIMRWTQCREANGFTIGSRSECSRNGLSKETKPEFSDVSILHSD